MQMTDELQLDVSLGQPRPWKERWGDVLFWLQELDNAYKDSDATQLTRAVGVFFRLCRELADWLEKEASVPASDYVHGDRDLLVCDAFAQTLKHHTRDSKDTITAYIARITTTSGASHSSSATIQWSNPSGATGKEDALDLARTCVAAWERFLKHHRLAT